MQSLVGFRSVSGGGGGGGLGRLAMLSVILLLCNGFSQAQETRMKLNTHPTFPTSGPQQDQVQLPLSPNVGSPKLAPCHEPQPTADPLLSQLRSALSLHGLTSSTQCMSAIPAMLSLPEARKASSTGLPQPPTTAPRGGGHGAFDCASNGFAKLRKRAQKTLACLTGNVLAQICLAAPSSSNAAQFPAPGVGPESASSSCTAARKSVAYLQRSVELTASSCCTRQDAAVAVSAGKCLLQLSGLAATISSTMADLKLNTNASLPHPTPASTAGNDSKHSADQLQCSSLLSALARIVRKSMAQVQARLGAIGILTLGNSTRQLMAVAGQLLSGGQQQTPSSPWLVQMLSKSVFYLLCDAVFPTCESSMSAAQPVRVVPPCVEPCRPIQALLNLLRPFLFLSRIPALDLLSQLSARCLAMADATRTSSCSDLVCDQNGRCGLAVRPRSTLSTRSAQKPPAAAKAPGRVQQSAGGGICLNYECPAPLRRTSVSAHRDADISRSLLPLHTMLQQAFPSQVRPYNNSLLSCGQDCVTVGFTSWQQKIARYILSVGSIGTEVFAIVALLAFWLNRDTLGNVLVRRLVLYFNISSAVTVSVFVPVAFANVESFICHDDGTRRLSEPSSSALCVLTESLAHLGISMTGLLFLSFTHAWYHLIRSLNQPGSSVRMRQATGRSSVGTNGIRDSQYLMDALYIGGSLLISLVFVLIVLVRRGIEGSPLFGICLARFDGFFLEFVIAPLAAFLAFGTIFLAIGLYHLAQYRRKDKERQKRRQMETVASNTQGADGKTHTVISWSASAMPSRAKRSASAVSSASSSTRAAFRRLIHQMLFYIIVIFINVAAMLVLGAYIGANQGDWTRQVSRHVQCRLTSCAQEPCPPLPQLSLAFFLAPFVIGFISSMILCSWAFSWKLWSRFFLRQPAAAKSDAVFTSTKFDASHVTEKKPELTCQDANEGKMTSSPRFSAISECEAGTGGSSPPSYTSTSPVSYHSSGRIVKNTAL